MPPHMKTILFVDGDEERRKQKTRRRNEKEKQGRKQLKKKTNKNIKNIKTHGKNEKTCKTVRKTGNPTQGKICYTNVRKNEGCSTWLLSYKYITTVIITIWFWCGFVDVIIL